MVRARAPAGQALGGRRILDGHETFPPQALEDRERRRQQLPAFAVVPTPVRDRYFDEGGQELGRRLFVARPHRGARTLATAAETPEFLAVQFATRRLRQAQFNYCSRQLLVPWSIVGHTTWHAPSPFQRLEVGTQRYSRCAIFR